MYVYYTCIYIYIYLIQQAKNLNPVYPNNAALSAQQQQEKQQVCVRVCVCCVCVRERERERDL